MFTIVTILNVIYRTGPTQASPEKATSDQYSFPADIWAFACTFIHVVSGHMPWEIRYQGCNRLEYIVRRCFHCTIIRFLVIIFAQCNVFRFDLMFIYLICFRLEKFLKFRLSLYHNNSLPVFTSAYEF